MSDQKGRPKEPLAKTAARLVRLAPKARKVVGKEWFFDNRVEAGYLGEALVGLTHSFENQDALLDFIEDATPEVVKALALKAAAFDAVMNDLPIVHVEEFDDETHKAIELARKAEAAS